MEYEYAISKQKPIIAFLHSDPGKIESARTDPANKERLESFRQLAQKKMCKMWSSPKEQGSVVSRSIIKLIKDRPGIGWVRADAVLDENAAREMLRLKTENEQLRQTLERAKGERPAGLETFALGEEIIELHFSFWVGSEHKEEASYLSWKMLFAALGPLMIDGATDTALKNKIEEVFRNMNFDLRRSTVSSAYIRDEDFQKIKVQFRALGLIAKADGNAALGPHWNDVDLNTLR